MRTEIKHKRDDDWKVWASRRAVLPALLCAATLAGIRFLLAQGEAGSSHHPTYDVNKPPPINLVEAYGLAAQHLGEATNRVHCVTATCHDRDGNRSAAWTFEFSNTNGHRANAKVFFSDKSVWIDPKTASALN
jgi:hypothetical protein